MQYRFPITFLIIYLVLQYGYQIAPEWLVKDLIVEQATVVPGASFINSIWPELNASAEGTRIVSPQGGINVIRGCEGTETILMMIAAFLASFAIGKSVRSIFTGLVLGIVFIYAINQIRIAGLFRVVIDNNEHFEMAHGYIAPLFVVGAAVIFFVGWLRLTRDRDDIDHV